jgi:uncharacterized membrane protein YcaP (DUF421 family)
MPTIVHAVIGYFVLLLTVRALRRRAGSQITLFEFVLIFLIGGVIILSTVGNDRSVTNCTCAVIAVGMMHHVLAWAKSKSPRFGAIIDGAPLVIIRHGEWQTEVMQGMKLNREDIEIATREAGLTNLSKIDYAILERNGRISILRKQD